MAPGMWNMGGIVPRAYANCPWHDRDDGGIRVCERARRVRGTMAANGTECGVGTVEGNEIVAPRGARWSVWLRRSFTGDQTRSTIVSGSVCTPRMASPILSRSIDRCWGPIHVAIVRGGRTGIAATICSRWKCWRGVDARGGIGTPRRPLRRRGIHRGRTTRAR